MKPVVLLSTTDDGTMKHGASEEILRKNRRVFLESNSCDPEKACLVRLEYDGDDYCRYNEVDKQSGGEGISRESTIVADALLTREKDQTLFLPLADCVGAAIWDEAGTALMVSHLGRHNLEQDGGTKSAQYFLDQTGASAESIHVFLSPAASGEAYPLFSFENKSLHEVAIEQLLGAGVKPENITVDNRDTTADLKLFSHSEFLKDRQEVDGRFILAATMQ